MKLKFFFFILSLLLVAVWGVLLVLSFKERGMLFYMVEGIITFSLILSNSSSFRILSFNFSCILSRK